MYSLANPRPLDFFPRTKRGHGVAHQEIPQRDGGGWPSRTLPRCVDPTCHLNAPKSKNAHDDQKANVLAWKAEHGFNEHTPLELCHSRELAR